MGVGDDGKDHNGANHAVCADFIGQLSFEFGGNQLLNVIILKKKTSEIFSQKCKAKKVISRNN